MGSNALKAQGAVRVSADQYHRIKGHVMLELSVICDCYEIFAYADKETFGDIDLLIISNKSNKEILEQLRERIPFVHTYESGPVCGFGYPIDENSIVQVDLIRSNERYLGYNLNYLDWNDLGNLIGRVAHKFGLKHGHDGLTLPVYYDATHKLGTVTITTDHAEAIKFLGFEPFPDVDFKDLREIFDYVVRGRYFNPDIYLLENHNHTARMRDRKRSTYNAFLEHIKGLPPRTYYPFNEDKSVYLPMIFSAFPESKDEFEELFFKAQMIKEANKVFNATMVIEKFGLEGKKLGEFMRFVKSRPPMNDVELVASMSKEKVIETINELYVAFNGS